MKIIVVINIFILISSFIYSQSDKPKSTVDSLSYSDTVWSEIAPVCLNLDEVRKMVSYPPLAVKDSIEGRIIIKCLVDKDGNVEKTGVISGPEIFYPEIKRVAMFLKFSAGRVNNYPVKVWVSVPFNFRLK